MNQEEHHFRIHVVVGFQMQTKRPSSSPSKKRRRKKQHPDPRLPTPLTALTPPLCASRIPSPFASDIPHPAPRAWLAGVKVELRPQRLLPLALVAGWTALQKVLNLWGGLGSARKSLLAPCVDTFCGQGFTTGTMMLGCC